MNKLFYNIFEVNNVSDYKKMYYQLAAKVADAIDLLIEAQQQGEDTYIESEDVVLTLSTESEDEQTLSEPE